MDNIGDKLRQAREEKNLTLESVSEVTKVKLVYLKALENDEFEKVVAPTYAKGFLKIYSEFLGLDSSKMVQEYMNEHIAESKQVLVLEGEKVKRSSPVAYFRGMEWKIVVGSIGFMVLVLLLIKIIFSGGDEEEVKIQKSAMIQNAKMERSDLIMPKEIKRSDNPTVLPKKKDVVLVVNAKQKVWIRVQADEKLVFEHTLQKGDSETWHARKQFKIRVGNAAGIDVTFNGKNIGNLGKRGKVVNLYLSRQGVKIEN
ncbi:MAG: DUF4115 domain-containing protein [Candidatus Theseobacter exili]|nr:DUF4115 domain-containing protein [Candidatus Theseobacter exili]